MNSAHLPERLLDLLVQQAVETLNDAEQQELNALLAQHPEVGASLFETPLASLSLAAPANERLPDALAKRILAATPASNSTAGTSLWQSARHGWWATAASLLLAITGWWPRLTGDLVPAPHPMTASDLAAARTAALQSGHAIQASWSPGNDASGKPLMGDVVFDPVTQTGFMRFRGIPANDPRLKQYQLWIADGARALPEPVDGGVFDATTQYTTHQGEVIIPFTAKLPVGKPVAFVVTVEKPGGVVVSRQEQVLALAKVL